MRSMDWSVWVVMPMTGRRCILESLTAKTENRPAITTSVYDRAPGRFRNDPELDRVAICVPSCVIDQESWKENKMTVVDIAESLGVGGEAIRSEVDLVEVVSRGLP